MTQEVTFDFDRLIDRRPTYAWKWRQYDEDVLPMWIADMDFQAPPAVIQALRQRVAHGIFGYEKPPDELRELIVARLKRLYNWEVTPDALLFLPGVVPGFNIAAAAFLAPHQGMLMQPPIYQNILNAPQRVGVQAHHAPLVRAVDSSYEVDFDRFEAAITPQTRMFLLCNPHNPVGRVFQRDELERMAEIALRHDLLICSDEIHGDLIYRGHQHIPIASLAPEIEAHTITLMAPSKTFNIAGLHCAFAVIPNAKLRARYEAGRRGMVGGANLLGYTAAVAAYRDGQPWLDALLAYLETNRDFVHDFVSHTLPGVQMVKPEGTYLAWLDCREAGIPGNPARFFLERARVALNDGAIYGPGGEGFVRLNFGCPRFMLREGLTRMRAALAELH